jgi:hypothetical protein
MADTGIKTIVNTNLKLKSGGGVVNDATDGLQVDSSLYGAKSISLTAGENITGATLPVPVVINKYIGVANQQQTTRDSMRRCGDGGSLYWDAQTFTLDANINRITSVVLAVDKNSIDGNMVVAIYATSAGKPTGAALGSTSIAPANLPSGYADTTFTFSSPITVSPSTMYAIIIYKNAAGNKYANVGINTAEGYAAGTIYNSSDGGASWGAAITDDYYFKVLGYYKQSYDDGEVIMSDANASATQDPNRLKFHGFAITTADADAAISVQMQGIVSGFTGLTPGLKYYVQDAIGTIGSSVGSATILVGIAISATQIQIEKDITKL